MVLIHFDVILYNYRSYILHEKIKFYIHIQYIFLTNKFICLKIIAMRVIFFYH